MEIRRLRAGEGAAIRELRLRALEDAPYAFSSSLADELDDPLSRWEGLADRSEAAGESVVFVACDAGAWIGMAGAYLREADAGVWGMWVAPEARRRGVGTRLLDAATDWARGHGAVRLELSVSDRATEAAQLYSARGFEPTGEARPLPSDTSATDTSLALRL